jgi:hypothetical protein
MLLLSPSTLVQERKSAPQPSSQASPVGRWKRVDDATSTAKSLVVIWEENGKLHGKIDRLIDVDPQDPDARGVRCEGDRQGRPLIGLRILWGFQKDGDQWSGGKVFEEIEGSRIHRFLPVWSHGVLAA